MVIGDAKADGELIARSMKDGRKEDGDDEEKVDAAGEALR